MGNFQKRAIVNYTLWLLGYSNNIVGSCIIYSKKKIRPVTNTG